MRETALSLFIVAPDANAATLKKLRGIGVATGTNIVAVQNTSDLVTPPPALSNLLIPDYFIEQGYNTKDWHRVFEISQTHLIRNTRDRNIITSKDSLSGGTDWVQIVNKFVRHCLKDHTKCRWHSITKAWTFKTQQSSAELTKWMNNHQIKKTSRLSALLKSLDILDQIASSGNLSHRERTIEIMLDTKHFEVRLEMPCPKPLEIERLQNVFSGVDTSLLAFTKTNDSLLVKIQLSFNISNENSFVVFITSQQRDSIGAQPEKEAS